MSKKLLTKMTLIAIAASMLLSLSSCGKDKIDAESTESLMLDDVDGWSPILPP